MSSLSLSLSLSLSHHKVVDIGSGKGYLSEHLAVCHKLTVVGMDSECSNTTGAIKRCRKVEKAHRGSELSRNAAVPLPIGLSGTDERGDEVLRLCL